jgi:hypothetical protein
VADAELFRKRIQKTLEELIFFVLDVEDKNQDAVLIDGIPNERRQSILKGVMLIEVLTDILYYPIKKKCMD